MSVNSIRAELETVLNSITPGFATAWENVSFTPSEGVPYQRVNFLFANPDDYSINTEYSQSGYMQVALFYPLQAGSKDALTYAQLIRDTFKIGNTYAGVIINKTPEIGAARIDGDRYMVPVFVRFIRYS